MGFLPGAMFRTLGHDFWMAARKWIEEDARPKKLWF